MTDRELLERAAKAAGYDRTMQAFAACDSSGNWIDYAKNVYWKAGLECRDYWNPLADGGDAFRLAVKLGLFFELELSRLHSEELASGVEYGAALRRAIVRAAAAMAD